MKELINFHQLSKEMFDGILDELGIVLGSTLEDSKVKLTIKSPKVLKDMIIGEYILVNGVRVKVSSKDEEVLSITIETQLNRKDTLPELKKGDSVNIQKARKLLEPIRAQLVTGEVDGIGEIISINSDDKLVSLRISYPKGIGSYLFEKGYICVDGVCLTIKDLYDNAFLVSLFPKTMIETTLGSKGVGHKVNIEANLITKILVDSISSIGCKGHEKNILNWIVSPY